MIVKSETLTARGRRTRAALLEAGREAFEEQGYDAVRVDDVCARAGVSHGTFYTYFDSKESLFGEVAGAVVGEMFAASMVGPAVPDDPYARVEAANRLYLRAMGGQLQAGADAGARGDHRRPLRTAAARTARGVRQEGAPRACAAAGAGPGRQGPRPAADRDHARRHGGALRPRLAGPRRAGPTRPPPSTISPVCGPAPSA
ncbi:helix-turn-helix domain-containing protein [Nonomuraea dietziae]|uniref:TetR/AcrR family transcriptional regulator n=1 Tax=Nonomuraea dietziae TaxID=65515 RepID=UPI0031D3DC25